MRIMLGLPTLSRGPLLDTAIKLGAPVMISASALAKWEDEGPVPKGHEFTPLERRIRKANGDTRPPTAAQQRRRMRSWKGWNRKCLDNVKALNLELNLDSAGFVALTTHGGYPWTPESYVFDLCSHPAITRFSSMDLCVEVERTNSHHDVAEFISKTVRLNLQVARLARDAGIYDKLMPVIQGTNADEYLRCFDQISSAVRPGATIGIGSFCRRPTQGPDGSLAIVDRLDRELPSDVRLHLFGVKGEFASAACAYGGRIDSIDSQAYGVRARHIANERRETDPFFSKSNAFTASVMEDWYHALQDRMRNPRRFTLQQSMSFSNSADAPQTILDALELIARAQFNDLIANGDLDHDQIVGGRMLEEAVYEFASDLAPGLRTSERWKGVHQLPAGLLDEPWFPSKLVPH